MNIYWGSYKNFEGPWARGSQRFTLSGTPTPNEEIMSVITATEGGTYDAVNMYDVCLWTVGVIQWCNRAPQFSVDDMLGQVVEAGSDGLKPLEALAIERSYTFRKVGAKYRFVRGGNAVDSVEEQQKLYFLNASGAKGSWDEESKAWARRWATASIKVWESASARKVQLDFTAKRVLTFAYGTGKQLMAEMPDTNIGRAWRAMYLSFAANNPAKAAASVAASVKQTQGVMTPWTEPWLANMAYMLTTNPGIAIYPIRYNAIRPVVEKIYGVNLPDYAKELTEWSAKNFQGRWYDPKELQMALVALGYDIGPEGATGVIDSKTVRALKEFEVDAGVPVEYQDGCLDIFTARALEKALEENGTASLS